MTPFARSNYRPPAPLDTFGYDEYRDIRYRPERAVWRESNKARLNLQFFLASFIHHDPVDVFVVDDGGAQLLTASRDQFSFGLSDGKVPQTGEFAYSGFRIHGSMNQANVNDEVAAFNGASYFRSLGRNQNYGLSARGITIDTVGGGAEEFPRFTKFWIEKPSSDSAIHVHALLDGPSISGAYHFVIRPGEQTVFDVNVTLFPRREIVNAGLAPLTSMFLFDQRNDHAFQDFRPAVHDNDGLAIHAADGRHVWRPLLNPNQVQTTRFEMATPRGFGLLQRKRDFRDYQDLEAAYEIRPSAWITPRGTWGDGAVVLVEIPIGAEWIDNIVCYWQSKEPMREGRPVSFAYRLAWTDEAPQIARRVTQTMIGKTGNQVLFQIDFEKADGQADEWDGRVTASAGAVSKPIVQANTQTGGIRCFFTLDHKDEKVIELALTLHDKRAPDLPHAATEVWTYRWLG